MIEKAIFAQLNSTTRRIHWMISIWISGCWLLTVIIRPYARHTTLQTQFLTYRGTSYSLRDATMVTPGVLLRVTSLSIKHTANPQRPPRLRVETPLYSVPSPGIASFGPRAGFRRLSMKVVCVIYIYLRAPQLSSK